MAYEMPQRWKDGVSVGSILTGVLVTWESGFLRGVGAYLACIVIGMILVRIIKPEGKLQA